MELDHVGDGLEPAVKIPGGDLGLAEDVVDLAHLVHVLKGSGRSGRRRHCSLEGDLGGRAGRQLHRLATR